VVEPRGRGVLDAPPSRGMTAEYEIDGGPRTKMQHSFVISRAPRCKVRTAHL